MFKIIRAKEGVNTPYVYNPLFEMGYTSRLVLQIFLNTWIVVHIALTITALLTDVQWIFWAGVLSALYLVDRGLHYNSATRNLSSHDAQNVALFVTPRANRAIILALNRSVIVGGSFFLNFTKVLLDYSRTQEMLDSLGVKKDEFAGRLDEVLGKFSESKFDKTRLLAEIEHTLLASRATKDKHDKYIDHADLFVALGSVGDNNINALFDLFEIRADDLGHVALFNRLQRALRFGTLKNIIKSLFRFKHGGHRVMNRAWTARPTPLLDMFSADLTDLARKRRVGFMVGHKSAYGRLIDVLSRPTTPNAILVGEAGIGKRTVVEHLALMIIKDKAPKKLLDKRVVLLDIGSVISGADQGKLQGRMRGILEEIHRAGNIILFIPDIHNLLKTSGEGELSIAGNILPTISMHGAPIIGSSVPREFRQFIEPDDQFREEFDIIRMEEVSHEQAKRILTYKSALLEREYKVKITYVAVKKAVDLALGYFRDKPLPLSAESLLKETVAHISNKGESVVTGDDITMIAEERTHSPIGEVGVVEAVELLHLEEKIHMRLVNQNEAVSAVSGALRAHRSGLARKGAPIGVFLFVGPTGVGKTELAKILAETQFGGEGLMARFDMSEYQDKESIYRLIGSTDGKISGALTDAVRERPYRLILLDEFEKAHRDILELFLQVFDDGRLTDSLGRTVHFENTIIIATSNAEANFIKKSIDEGRHMSDIKIELDDKLATYFSPELLNRFTEVVLFKSLSKEDIREITHFHITSIIKQLDNTRGVKLTVGDDVIEFLARLGYGPVFGARPLERVIREKLRARLSEKILLGGLRRGDRVVAQLKNNAIEIHEI